MDKEIIVDNVLLDPNTIVPEDNLSELYESILTNNKESIKIKFISNVKPLNDIQTHIKTSNDQIPTIHYRKMVNDSKDILEEMKIPEYSHKILYILLLKISDYILSKGINPSIKISKIEDPEEDWDLIKLNIYVNKSLDYIFKNLNISIYDIVDNNITKELAKKIFVKIESRTDID